MNISTFKEMLPYAFKANLAVMVQGHHGVGKSEGVRQFCAESEYTHPKLKKKQTYGFVDLRLGTMDVGDLLGLPDFKTEMQPYTYVDSNGVEQTAQREVKVETQHMRPEWWPTDPDSRGVIFLDEVNRGTRDVLQAIFQLVLDKKLHCYTLPKGWSVIAAMNPSTQDYIVTDLSDKAFLDRFCHIKLAPSKQEFIKFAQKTGVEPEVLQFLQDQPKMLQTELEAFDLNVTPSRRSWMAVDRFMKSKPPQHVQREVLVGLVGSTAASAFMKSLSTVDRPINAKDVIGGFTKIKDRVKKYSDPKANRIDMLKFTADSILEYAQNTKKKLTKPESKNLQEFLKLIPKDLAFDLCRSLYMEDCTREAIDESTDLLKILADARDMKVEGLNA